VNIENKYGGDPSFVVSRSEKGYKRKRGKVWD